MTLTNSLLGINFVDGVHSLLNDTLTTRSRLTSTIDAATRAGHDFHKVVLGLTLLDLLEELVNVLGVDNSALDGAAIQIHRELLDTFQASGLSEVNLRKSLASGDLIGGSESGFHDTSARTEDITSTGGL